MHTVVQLSCTAGMQSSATPKLMSIIGTKEIHSASCADLRPGMLCQRPSCPRNAAHLPRSREFHQAVPRANAGNDGQYAHAQSGWLPAQYAQSSSPSAQQPAGLRDGELARCHARPLEALPGGYDCSLASAQHGVGMTDVGRALPGTGMHSMYSNPA